MIEVQTKTYRAIRHDVVRKQQRENADALHHPQEKSGQIHRVLSDQSGLKILELFAGRGNCTQVYENYGSVDAYDKTHLGTGDSHAAFHRLIGERKIYDVIDLDPYGFPNRFFPDIYLLLDDGVLFITMPKPYVNILNGITAAHLTSYYGEPNPSLDTIIERVALWGICHWRKVELLDLLNLGSVWRMCFQVKKVKATEYTGVRNQPVAGRRPGMEQRSLF